MARQSSRSFVVAASLLAFVAALRGQPPAPRSLPPSVTQAGFSQPQSTAATKPAQDISKLAPFAQQLYLTAHRGSEWLYRMHQPTGRFLAGWDAALNQAVDGAGFVEQAPAAAALARAARYYKNEAYGARAAQAVLTLLAETGPDPRDPTSRCPTAPPSVVNKIAGAGTLLAAIHELPNATPDLLEQGEQLARFIARQQRPDGSLASSDQVKAAPIEMNHAATGQALAGLIKSYPRKPAPWKLEVVRRAVAFYRPQWREHRHPAWAAAFVPACAEAFIQSQDRARDVAFAEFTCELADWLCSLQLHTLDALHPLWHGGFAATGPDGQRISSSPSVFSAAMAEAILAAARVTRQMPDAGRYTRYRDAATLALQFATTLQYTEANTQHFTALYRQQNLLGGFHASHTDGVLRLEGNQQAVSAMLAYLGTSQ